MSLARRLLLLVGPSLGGMLGIGALGLIEMDRVRDSASYAIVNSVPSYDVLDETLQEFVDAMGLVSLHALSADAARKADLERRYEALWRQVLATLDRYEPLISNHQDRKLLEVDRDLLRKYDAQRRTLFAVSDANRSEEARRLLLDTQATVDQITDALQAHRKYNHALAAAGGEEAQRIYRKAALSIAGITLIAVLASGLLALVVIRRLLRELGGEPEYAASIAASIAAGDLDVAIEARPDDRVSLLHAMRDMRDSLRKAQVELVAASRQAGMAEIATNVLHNVGNVLNSINVSAAVLGNQVRASKAAGLARAVQLIDAHRCDLGEFLSRDEKGRQLPDYLDKLVAALAAEQRTLLDELGQMAKSVEHVKDIVATQQSYAGASRVLEPVRVRELIDDALRMNSGALARHEVSVVKDVPDLPALPLDRNRVLQILVNLISNAKYAMDASRGPSHRLTLRAALIEAADGRRLRIAVTDEGEGIAPENLTRIFAHGFTTRRHGHGFGLHSCVLAAQEMGGSLMAQSEGPGRGATFTLELPMAAQGSRA